LREEQQVDLRIGIIQAARELDVELGSEVSQEEVLGLIENALSSAENVLWLTDKRGRRVGVPSARIAYVEVGTQDDIRRVGFGAS
jgi:hypothetical protein